MNTDDIPDSEFVWRIPEWMVKRAAELRAEGKTDDEIISIIKKEALL